MAEAFRRPGTLTRCRAGEGLDEGRARIASNIAKLPKLLGRGEGE